MLGRNLVGLTEALAFYIKGITDDSLSHLKNHSFHTLLIGQAKY
jgi:hypothetical protein